MKKVATLLVAMTLLLSACSGDKGGEDTPPDTRPIPTPTPEPLPEKNVLFFLAGTDLYITDTGKETTELLEELGTTDVSISPDGSRYAFSGGPERPHLNVTRVGEKSSIELPGYSPSWSPDGKYLAAVVPDPNYLICDAKAQKAAATNSRKGCDVAGRAVAYDAHNLQKDPQAAVGAGLWEVVGWSAGKIVVYDEEEDVLSVGKPGGGNAARVVLPDPGPLSIDPVELRVLATQSQLLYIGDPTELHPVSVSGTVDFTAWSPNGTKALLAVTDGVARDLRIFDVETGEVKPVEGSKNLVGTVVWSNDGETFAMVTGKKRSLRATLCNLALTCEKLFKSDGAIDLIYLDS
ncbi:MAG: hypothetical protein QOG54_1416 [Actinomycetota bacterium]|jgi:WD40 repeat protein|nr:hypothetical protein [Actinomycetota bacterium]